MVHINMQKPPTPNESGICLYPGTNHSKKTYTSLFRVGSVNQPISVKQRYVTNTTYLWLNMDKSKDSSTLVQLKLKIIPIKKYICCSSCTSHQLFH